MAGSSRKPKKPWSRVKDARRVMSPDQQWAADIEAKILADAHPLQRDAIRDVARRITYLVGRGGGKTTALRGRALIKATRIRRAKVLYFAKTRMHAKDLMWFPLKDLCERLGLQQGVDVQFNETELRCTILRTGAMIQLSGADDLKEIEKWRGQSFDEVQIDEGASHVPELLATLVFRIVGPRLGDRDGCIVLCGTPGHILRGLFYDATRPGSTMHRAWADRALPEFKGWKGWSSHAWTLKDVIALPNAAKLFPALVKLWAEALVEKESNKWSDENPIWRREYEGRWAADDTENVFKYRPHDKDGKPFNQWDPERIGPMKFAKLPEDRKDWEYAYAHDMGHSDPYAFNVFAFSPTDTTRTILHVYGYERVGMYAKPIAELLLGEKLDLDKPAGAIGVTGWPVGQIADMDPAHLAELANVYGLRITKAEKKMDYKFGAIELVNGDLTDGRLKILKDSELEKQLQALQWKADDLGALREDKAQANHSTDTLVYGRRLIAHLFESGQAGTPAAAAPDAREQPPEERRNNAPGDEDFSELLSDGTFDDDWGG